MTYQNKMRNNKTLIGFAGRKRSGKGVLANMMKEEYNAKIITVADYLKRLCCEILEVDYDTLNYMKDNGERICKFPIDRLYHIINEKVGLSTDEIFNAIGNTHIGNVREMLQVVGTDLIRRYQPNWHIWQMENDIKSCSDDTIIAIDDVRFPNERKSIESFGGKCFFVIRPCNNDVSNHISETSLTWKMFDDESIIINDKDMEQLKDNFRKMYDSNYEYNLRRYINAYKQNYNEELNNIIQHTLNPLVREDLKILL
jgi:hypothetical protein